MFCCLPFLEHDTERHIQSERETDRQRETEIETERHRDTERHRERRDTETERERRRRDRQRQTQTQTQAETDTDRQGILLITSSYYFFFFLDLCDCSEFIPSDVRSSQQFLSFTQAGSQEGAGLVGQYQPCGGSDRSQRRICPDQRPAPFQGRRVRVHMSSCVHTRQWTQLIDYEVTRAGVGRD